MRADALEQARFALGSLRPDLGKSGGDDCRAPALPRQRVLHCLEHVLAGQTEDREVDIPRNLGQRRVAGHACYVFPRRFTAYASPVKPPSTMLRKTRPPIVPARGEAP